MTLVKWGKVEKVPRLTLEEPYQPTVLPPFVWSTIHMIYYGILMGFLMIAMLWSMTVQYAIATFFSFVNFVKATLQAIKQLQLWFLRLPFKTTNFFVNIAIVMVCSALVYLHVVYSCFKDLVVNVTTKPFKWALELLHLPLDVYFRIRLYLHDLCTNLLHSLSNFYPVYLLKSLKQFLYESSLQKGKSPGAHCYPHQNRRRSRRVTFTCETMPLIDEYRNTRRKPFNTI